MTQRATKQSRKSRTKPIAAFGAAISTLAVTQAPPAQAAIIDLSFNPTTVPYDTNGPDVPVSLYAGSANVFNFIALNYSTQKQFVGLGVVNSSSPVPQNKTFDIVKVSPGDNLSSGTHIFGFKNGSNQVGWIRVDMGGFGNPITFLAAAYNDTPGGPIHAGTGAPTVPEPASLTLAALGTLAAGASEIRRRRRANAPSA